MSGFGLRDRALAWLPGPAIPTAPLVLFALGAGAAASVTIAVIQQLARLVLQQRQTPSAGDALAVATGVLVACLVRGLDRSALWVVLVHAVHLVATFFTALLVYMYMGPRASGDPLANAGQSFGALLVGAALGAAIGMIARAAIPTGRAHDAPLLLRAIGVAVLAGTIAHVLWPTALLTTAIGGGRPDDVRAVAISLPDLLAGPVAGGIYAAQRGARYAELLVVGILLALPSAIAQLVLARAQLALDPGLRGTFAVLFMLLGMRIAAWPLAAAFAQGFLTPPPSAPTVADRHIN